MEESWLNLLLPFELIADVFERLPLKDLLRCQAVSKLWREKLWSTQSWLEVTVSQNFPFGLRHILAKFNPKVFQELHLYDYELLEGDVAQICRLTNINSLIYEQPYDCTAKETNKLNSLLLSLTRLQHLTLGLWNDQVDLQHLTRLTELCSLELDVAAGVTLAHFDSLSYLTQLTHFTFYASVLPPVLSERFTTAMNWPRMRSLALILKSPVDLTPIAQYTQLVGLELQSASLPDKYLAVHSWTSLTRLCLTCASLTAESFTKLGCLTNLEELSITKNDCVKDILWISSLVKLNKLNLGHTSISDTDVELLASLPKLEVINLCGCRKLRSKAAKVLGTMPCLKSLNISESGILFTPQRSEILDSLSRVVDLVANDTYGPADLGWG